MTIPEAIVCANCDETSVYEVADPGALPIYLCATHLPEHMAPRARTSQIRARGQFKSRPTPPRRPVQPNTPELPIYPKEKTRNDQVR